MSDTKNSSDDSVKVTDRRRFGQDGKSKDNVESHPSAKVAADNSDLKSAKGGSSGAHTIRDIDFPTFVLSLATSAQVHLGAVPNPASGVVEKDITLAKQTVDILGILEEKTKGNLTPEEGRLMEAILFDLRMMYVEAQKSSKT